MTPLEQLIEDTQLLLEDIMLSGFYNIHSDIIQRLDQLAKQYGNYGMQQGEKMLEQLLHEMLKNRSTLTYDKEVLTRHFARVSFYLACL